MRAVLVLFLAIAFIPDSAVAGPPAHSKVSPPAKPASPVTEDKWRWMPGGTFTYGCEPRSDCEKKRGKRGVRAKVDSFWIMKGRTTVPEYQECVLAQRCSEPDANAFCTTWRGRTAKPREGGFPTWNRCGPRTEEARCRTTAPSTWVSGAFNLLSPRTRRRSLLLPRSKSPRPRPLRTDTRRPQRAGFGAALTCSEMSGVL
jgi:formylglycine-generating enzyme required for sulfatase activity